MLPSFVHKIFTFYIEDVPKFMSKFIAKKLKMYICYSAAACYKVDRTKCLPD